VALRLVAEGLCHCVLLKKNRVGLDHHASLQELIASTTELMRGDKATLEALQQWGNLAAHAKGRTDQATPNKATAMLLLAADPLRWLFDSILAERIPAEVEAGILALRSGASASLSPNMPSSAQQGLSLKLRLPSPSTPGFRERRRIFWNTHTDVPKLYFAPQPAPVQHLDLSAPIEAQLATLLSHHARHERTCASICAVVLNREISNLVSFSEKDLPQLFAKLAAERPAVVPRAVSGYVLEVVRRTESVRAALASRLEDSASLVAEVRVPLPTAELVEWFRSDYLGFARRRITLANAIIWGFLLATAAFAGWVWDQL
jgi:hypothetical protein